MLGLVLGLVVHFSVSIGVGSGLVPDLVGGEGSVSIRFKRPAVMVGVSVKISSALVSAWCWPFFGTRFGLASVSVS